MSTKEKSETNAAEIEAKVMEGELPASALDELSDEELDSLLGSDADTTSSDGEDEDANLDGDQSSDEDSDAEAGESTVSTDPEDANYDKSAVDGAKYREKADEANHFRQKFDASNKKLELMEKQMQKLTETLSKSQENPMNLGDFEMVKDADGDIDYEKSFKKMFEFQKNFMANMSANSKNVKSSLEQISEEASTFNTVNDNFTEIENLQAEAPNLSTSTPFRQLDNQFIEFKGKIGQDYERFFSDADFRASKEAEGIKLPEEFDTYRKILVLMNKKVKDNYPSLRSAYRDSDDYSPVTKHESQKPNADKIAAEERQKLESESTIMSDGHAGSDEGGDFDVKAAEAYLAKWAGKEDLMSPEESEKYDQILDRLGVG